MQRRLNFGPRGSVNHVARTALSLLNRLVDSNFDHIAKRIVALVNDPPVDEKNLLAVAHLCTESAILQPNRAVLYARLCRALPDRIQRVRGQLVRKHVVDTLVNGFEEGYQTSPDVTGTLKRRYFGVVRFLGDLYKVGISPEQMIRGYVKQLLGSVELPLDADLEALCILLDTGRFLDTAKAKSQMDSHFIRISELAATSGIPMRIRFMLQDICHRRTQKWAEVDKTRLDWVVPTPLDPDPRGGKYLSDLVLVDKIQRVFRGGQSTPAGLRVACMHPDYVPTLIKLLLQQAIKDKTERAAPLVRQFLESITSWDLVLTAAVLLGFHLALKQAALDPDGLRHLRWLLNAAGLVDERGEALMNRALEPSLQGQGLAADDYEPIHVTPSDGMDLFLQVSVALSLPTPVIAPGIVRGSVFDDWLARMTELAAEATRRRQEVREEKPNLERTLVITRDANRKLTQEIDVLEQKQHAEHSRKGEAETQLQVARKESVILESELERERQRWAALEARLQRARLEQQVWLEKQRAIRDTARKEGRWDMLSEIMELLDLQREEEEVADQIILNNPFAQRNAEIDRWLRTYQSPESWTFQGMGGRN